LGLLGLAVAIIGYWALVFYYEHRLPEVFRTEDYLAETVQANRIVSSEGDVLYEYGDQRRSVIPQERIPKIIKSAVLAAEDADFYRHDGLDYLGMARAMYKNLRDQRFSQGASTITQQIAKTFFLSSEKTIERKLKEVVLARRLEHELSKDELLYLYLNQIYWGHGRYGIGEAARFYFGKEVEAVTLADAALLAGLIAAPERYSPFKSLRKATERRAFVLDQMALHGLIDVAAADEAKREPIRLRFSADRDPHLGLGGYATAMVKRFVIDAVGSQRVAQGGLIVHTTIATRTQQIAERTLRRGLVGIDKMFGLAEPLRHVSEGRIPRLVAQLKRKLPRNGVRSGKIVLGVITAIDTASGHYVVNIGYGPGRLPFTSVARYSDGHPPEAAYRVGDVIRVSPRTRLASSWSDGRLPVFNIDQGPQAALVAIEPRTRAIRALVGGYDFETHPYNRAASARRQAGSTFKPIVFAAALEAGAINTDTRFANIPETYSRGIGGGVWQPKNFSKRYDGKKYTARLALAKSINVIAVKVLQRLGLAKLTSFARKIGIQGKIERDLSVALGSTEVSPLELANAYSSFAAMGMYRDAILVTKIEDNAGQVLFEQSGRATRVLSSEVAWRATEMMRAVVTHGTAKRLKGIGRPVVGKTGTTDKGIDNWFAGYSRELVSVVWVGFDDRRSVEKATGGTIAAPIFGRFIADALEGRRVREFRPPPGVQPLSRVAAPEAAPRKEKMVDPTVQGEDRLVQQMELLYQQPPAPPSDEKAQ
jgi:penicillin-binding protein 1A